MIAKRVPMKNLRKSDYGELVKYILDPQDKQERVGKVDVTNCHSDKPEFAITEVLNTQAQNRRATGDRTYHLMVSFRAGENPTAETLGAVEDRLCAGLGFREHQRVSAVHYDTDNVHMHIAINAIHPTRNTLHNPYNDFKTLAQLCEKLEDEYGLAKDNHVAQKRGAENRVNDMEAHSGVQSLLGWIKQECEQQMQGAQSWAQLHQVMHEHGLQLRERGNGLIVVAADGTAVKGSSIDRSYSKRAMEGRFGKFQPAPQRAQEATGASAAYQPKPVRARANTAELYARYQEDQQTSTTGRAAAMERMRKDKQQAIEDAKRVARLKRAAIKASREAGSIKKILYSAAHQTLRKDLGNIAEQFAQERERIAAAHQRRAWADWLQAQALQGDAEALEAMRGRPGAKASGPVDGITKAGTIIYRLGATAVRDDGSRLSISRGADRDGLEAALKMAAQRFGPVIAVTGTDVFKARVAEAAARSGLAITFSSPALEQRRQQLLSETDHDRSSARTDGGRTSRSSPGGRRPVATRDPGGPAGAGSTEPRQIRSSPPWLAVPADGGNFRSCPGSRTPGGRCVPGYGWWRRRCRGISP
ncbi:TraI/MobA(P) family conjugative relaxase [uncultured Thiodictyon sp.]|uniref:TraI/MobA(P) family conjugative relaxase n=1 Tax=uncultured Thiodictyon sp. TaxID=1846217 RepID=UPI0025FDC2E3|nr:TraI/MobA(P) family conjugative relaxase [uncultured Thiodictyon sp.]